VEKARAVESFLRVFIPPPRTERSLSGLACEVRQEFVEAQRMRAWGR